MSLTPSNSTRFSLPDPGTAALRAAAGDRQAACLRDHRELDELARLSARESRGFEQRDHISHTPSRHRRIKGRKDG